MFSRVQQRIPLVGVVCAVFLAGVVRTDADNARAAASDRTVVVTLHHYMFNPMTVTIVSGTTVKWHWEDGVGGDHNITPLKKRGGLLFKGASTRNHGYYSVKFTKRGTYYYECSIHPLSMQAKIIVR